MHCETLLRTNTLQATRQTFRCSSKWVLLPIAHNHLRGQLCAVWHSWSSQASACRRVLSGGQRVGRYMRSSLLAWKLCGESAGVWGWMGGSNGIAAQHDADVFMIGVCSIGNLWWRPSVTGVMVFIGCCKSLNTGHWVCMRCLELKCFPVDMT